MRPPALTLSTVYNILWETYLIPRIRMLGGEAAVRRLTHPWEFPDSPFKGWPGKFIVAPRVEAGRRSWWAAKRTVNEAKRRVCLAARALRGDEYLD